MILNCIHNGMLGFFGMPGWQEGLIIVFALLLLFGGKKLPELARGMGKGLRHFKEELSGVKREIEREPQDEDTSEPDSDTEDDYQQDTGEDAKEKQGEKSK